MKLEPPVLAYLEGDRPSHAPLSALSKHARAWSQEEVEELLRAAGLLSAEGKTTKLALQRGVVDTCEGKVLWNLLEVKRALVAQEQVEASREAAERSKRERERARASEPAWVDLGTVGTYFAASNIVVGRWLDQLGLRAVPTLSTNESGAVDMLDVARQAQQKQAAGFLGKEPTERALSMGLARKITVVNRKQKEVEVTQWNLELLKAVLVKAGHPLDTDKTWSLKGKGRNSDVKVITADDRARELYLAWKREHANPKTRAGCWKRFEKQPRAVLVRVEALMNRPGFLTEGRYRREAF